MTIKELKELMRYAAKRQAPTNYSLNQVDSAVADGLKELTGSINQFMKNRYDLYDIIVENVDSIVPARVIDSLGIFAEVRQIPQGQKAIFKRKIGKTRARKFLTQVGLSGVYETFRLDSESFELGGHAVGGAVTLDWERMLDGVETMSDVMEVMTEGLTDSVFVEVQKALINAASVQNVPAANRVTDNKFDAAKMFKLISTVRAYGDGAVIFAPPEFIAEMGADAIVPVPANGNYGGVYHPQDIDAIHNQGYINIFRGTPIVQMPQSFSDENNDKVVMNPQYAYVLPTGRDRVVKVVLEGDTQINDFKNRDNSIEIHMYKKIGVGILSYNNWAIYQNTGISTDNWDQTYYGF